MEILAIIGLPLAFLGIMFYVAFVAPRQFGLTSRDTNPKSVETGSGEEDLWRKENEAFQRKQVTDWEDDFQQTMREAWEDTMGISVQNAMKYIRAARDCEHLRTIIKAWEGAECTEPRETYTQKSLDGKVKIEYTNPCHCVICRVPEFRKKLEVKEDIIRILDVDIKKRNPKFVSALDLDDTGARMVNSWEKIIEIES